MAVSPIQLIAPQIAPNVKTTKYTAGAGSRVRVDYMAMTNYSAANVQVSVWVGPAGASQRIKDKTILPGECYLCPEVVGALLYPGDEVAVLSSAAGAIYMQANGVEFT
jgi:hypothetical protein